MNSNNRGTTLMVWIRSEFSFSYYVVCFGELAADVFKNQTSGEFTKPWIVEALTAAFFCLWSELWKSFTNQLYSSKAWKLSYIWCSKWRLLTATISSHLENAQQMMPLRSCLPPIWVTSTHYRHWALQLQLNEVRWHFDVASFVCSISWAARPLQLRWPYQTISLVSQLRT